jgi:ketosteroid isomerase-like protein
MRDRSFVSLALIAIGVGVFVLQNAGVVPTVRSVWNARRDAVIRERDRAEIEKLHRMDVAATLSGDLAALANLWTDDIVRLQPGAGAEIGKQTLTAVDQRRRAANPGFRAVTYVPEIKDLTVTADGWAFEWGTFTASYVVAPGSGETHIRANLVRIFKRQADGTWKGALGMWCPSD